MKASDLTSDQYNALRKLYLEMSRTHNEHVRSKALTVLEPFGLKTFQEFAHFLADYLLSKILSEVEAVAPKPDVETTSNIILSDEAYEALIEAVEFHNDLRDFKHNKELPNSILDVAVQYEARFNGIMVRFGIKDIKDIPALLSIQQFSRSVEKLEAIIMKVDAA